MVPFAIDLLRRDDCIGVGARHVDMVGLYNLGHLVVNAQDGQALLVSIREGGFELLMGCGQSLDRQEKHSDWGVPEQRCVCVCARVFVCVHQPVGESSGLNNISHPWI